MHNDDTHVDEGTAKPKGLCDDSDSDTDEEVDVRELKVKVLAELRLFKNSTDRPAFGSKTNPLHWWATHAALYPLLGHLDRVVLVVPGSQIECKRVFSLVGLLTSILRNRMSPENLGSIVFLSKNLDANAALDELLCETYGGVQWSSAKPAIGTIFECGACEVELDSYMMNESGNINWDILESILEENESLLDENTP